MLPHRVIALIPAAGGGVRMGVGRSKLLLSLAGENIIERTVRTVGSCGLINHVVVVAPPTEIDRFKELHLECYCPALSIISGGATRQESVHLGVRFCASLLKPGTQTYIAVHDGARCLVTAEIIERAVRAAFLHKAVTVAVPAVDSLKRVDDQGWVLASIDRSGVWEVQTPQVFEYGLLSEAHQRAPAGAASDDASLVESIHPVYVVQGSKYNFKITTPEDYALAKLISKPS